VRSGAAKRKAIEEQIAEESRFKQRATMTIGTVTMLRNNGITINDNPQAAITVTYSARTAPQRKWKRLRWCRGWKSRGTVTRRPSGTTRPPARQSRISEVIRRNESFSDDSLLCRAQVIDHVCDDGRVGHRD
jgi:hypothetical protein